MAEISAIPSTSPLIVRAGVPEIDGCKLWTAVKAFVVSQGVKAVLEHTIRDREGRPINLSDAFGSVNTGESESESETALGNVKVRVKEPLGTSASSVTNPVWEIPATIMDSEAGIVRIRLPEAAVEYAGIYTVSWALYDDEDPIWIDESFMMVERSLFPKKGKTLQDNLGPPSLNEVRLCLLERSPADNDLLNRLEFSTEQILYAILAPVQYYNEQPPPIGCFTTRSFPWTAAWLDGILGNLLMAAAHNYRRNALQNVTGGVSINDKAKEPEYLKMAQLLLQSYRDWVLNKKVEINLQQLSGHVGSIYGGRRY